ncbi:MULTISPECIES: hypothetical protein [Streptomyces]|uniref:Uncharacterized protein n=1 Tax=Streptomyces viridochromogenes TaxID=1938 RepID=A0A0L8K5T2_STRVR|nr:MULTISPECIES: hypothetical protein [Streptomyces]KOG21267.1 hypothetical protein ADK34_22700 [Streptomyces viridochromogenes]
MFEELADQLRQYGVDTGHQEFAARTARALEAVVADLQALPREDSFRRCWSNERATVIDLYRYVNERLVRNPQDSAARRALVALSLVHGANDGGLSLLGPEIAADPAIVADAVTIADWVFKEIGFDLTPELREACSHADRQALEALARTDNAGAARAALRVLGGGTIRDC